MRRVMIVYGTRPEGVKVAPVIRTLKDASPSGELTCITVSTGQHRELLAQVHEIFGLTPDEDIDVFAPGQTLNALTSRIFARLDPLLESYAPDALLVQGDTTTVAAAAMAAFYRQIPVVHLEAGLRSGNLHSPFPEEANRRMTSQIASLHLAPTQEARDNLLRENIDPASIVVTGNTVIDALLHTRDQHVPPSDPAVRKAIESGRPIILVTAHRRENWGEAIAGVGRALRRLAEKYPDYIIILPLHANPAIRDAVAPSVTGVDNIVLASALSYGEFITVMDAAHLILTDSGGVQEEAPSLGKPVLVMRENTERPEAVAAGTVRLIGAHEDRIVAEASALIDSPTLYESMAHAVNPYGDGHAAERTVAAIEHLLGLGDRLPDFSYTPHLDVPLSSASLETEAV